MTYITYRFPVHIEIERKGKINEKYRQDDIYQFFIYFIHSWTKNIENY